jgi:arabinose-5-phosphate isomerase
MNIQNRAKELIQTQIDALSGLSINTSISEAVEQILSNKGKIIATGIGKAGYIARKAASTFCTTGTPAVFLHPGDASHGDVGLLSKYDLILAFSNSGKNREVLETVHFAKKLGAHTVISITKSKTSPLGEMSDVVIELGEIKESCPIGFTPTASTTAMLVIADTLALLSMEQRGFSAEDFSLRHHGGYLGVKAREEIG